MKKLLIVLLSIVSISAYSQAVNNASLKSQSSSEIAGKAYSPTRAQAMHDAETASKKSILDGIYIATGTNAYSFSDTDLTSLTSKTQIDVRFTNANTTAVTLNPAGLGAKAVKDASGNNLASGDIKAGETKSLSYDGTEFRIIGGGGGSTVVTDGNMTTANGSAADFGGTTTQDTYVDDSSDGAHEVQFGGTTPFSGFYLNSKSGSEYQYLEVYPNDFRASGSDGTDGVDLQMIASAKGLNLQAFKISGIPSIGDITQINLMQNDGSSNIPLRLTAITSNVTTGSLTQNFIVSGAVSGTEQHFLEILGGTNRQLKALGPVLPGQYATGSLPSAANHTGGLAYDTSTGTIKFSNGSSWAGLGGGSSTFTSLTDGPGSFSGKTLNFIRVNSGETALEYRTPANVLTDLGSTTIGSNLFKLPNPSSITFPRYNADNSVSSLDASSFRTAIGLGTLATQNGITVGTSTITSGTDTYALYNNAGILGNRAVTGTGNSVLASSPTLTNPIVGTQTANDNSTKAASTAYVDTKNVVFGCYLSDLTTTLSSGTNKGFLVFPAAFTVTAVYAYVLSAQSTGTLITVDINESATTILSTKLTIDNTETGSNTAATPAVISDASLAAHAQITFDIDAASGGFGLLVEIVGHF